MKKKLFSILLSLAMVVTMMPAMAVTAFAIEPTPELPDVSAKPTANILVYNGYEQELVTPVKGFSYTYTVGTKTGTAIPTEKDAGTYTVEYSATTTLDGIHPTHTTGTVTVTIDQADPINVAPAVIPAQQYTGTSLNLIKAGTGTVKAGTLVYAFNNSAAGPWSTTATQISQGSYSVYYTVEYSTAADKKNYKDIGILSAGTASIVGPAKVTLRYTSYTYNGLTKTPEIVSVVGYDGLQIPSTAYQVTGQTSAIAPGTYTLTVSGTTADYKWSTDRTWKIVVKKTSIKSLKKGSKSFTVKVKELDEDQVDGYQVRYSTKSSMSSAKIKKIGSDSETVKKTVKSLKKGKKYYVQARSYVTVNGVKYYSDWSAKKTVKTK